MYVKSNVVTGMPGGRPESGYSKEAVDTDVRAERIRLLKNSSMGLKKQVPLTECNPVRKQEGDALTFFDIHEGLEFTVFIKTYNDSVYTKYIEGEVVTGPDQEDNHDDMWWFRANLRDPNGQEWDDKLCCMGVFGITKYERPGAQSPEWNDRFFVVEGRHDTVPELRTAAVFAGTIAGKEVIYDGLELIPAKRAPGRTVNKSAPQELAY